MKESQHVPVLLEEVQSLLDLHPGQTVVDATLGGGGYTRALLKRLEPNGKLIAFDWDSEAIERFRKESPSHPHLTRALAESRLILVNESFASVKEALHREGVEAVDAIVADLGFSSDQLEDPKRGLSFQLDGPLDMRLNSKEKVTAALILQEWNEERLTELFRLYGDEPEAKKIARAIVRTRMTKPLTRTNELRTLIEETVSPKRRRARIHPATHVFQALRIAVNSEREALERFLRAALAVLKPGGKLVVVTFHSGEDAIVKHFFQKESRGCICGMRPCHCGREKTVTLLTKKPVVPSALEQTRNPRSRSAKLRALEKLG